MKRHFYYLILLFALSCNNERVLQLPEIENAKISEVLDVSPAYLFYDESLNDISFSTSLDPNTTLSLDNIEQSLETIIRECGKDEKQCLVLNPNLSFQNYISLKNVLRPLENRILNNEFIY